MTKAELLEQITRDLAQNYRASDATILSDILDDVIEDALYISNRTNTSNNLKLLRSNIKKAVKSIYLLRGVEEVKSDTQSGLSNTYDDVMETMLKDIIRQNKRLLK